MKRTLIISLALFFSFAPFALAQGFVPLAPIPGLTEGVTANTEGIAKFLDNLYKYLIGLAGVLAVVMITWGGIDIAMNRDNVSKITDSKGKIYNAIFGLVIVLSPVLVFSIINPSILNLSLNLQEIKPTIYNAAPAVSTSTQTSVRAGSTRAIYNGQVIGFPEDYYAAPQAGGFCIQLKPDQVADGKTYFCARSPDGCRQIYNDLCKSNLTVVACTDGQSGTQQACVKY